MTFSRKEKLRTMIIMITMVFGASDPANLSSKVLKVILQSDKEYTINLCLVNTILCTVRQLARHYGNSRKKGVIVHIHINPRNMAELMYRADLVITSPGTSAVEAFRSDSDYCYYAEYQIRIRPLVDIWIQYPEEQARVRSAVSGKTPISSAHLNQQFQKRKSVKGKMKSYKHFNMAGPPRFDIRCRRLLVSSQA